jgi:CheY-like chemotaxis protein
VESQPGEGSTFWFTLPLKLDRDQPEDLAAIDDLRNLRALIVDDSEINRRILHEQITGWGMRNGSYETPEEALSALRSAQEAGDPYHFLLLDYHMPGMDGITLARAIKADTAINSVRIVMLTSGGQSGAVRNQESCIEACLHKPVRQSQLIQTLCAVWSKNLKDDPHVSARLEDRAANRKAALAVAAGGTAIRVLVAEDNSVNQKVAALMLAKLGVRADLVANGREAVDAAKAVPYDLIFMDCQMPELDGYDAAREIRMGEGLRKHAPIIAMTAEVMTGSRERCLAAGMDEHIAKPVKVEDLFDVLMKWVPKRIPADTVPKLTGELDPHFSAGA